LASNYFLVIFAKMYARRVLFRFGFLTLFAGQALVVPLFAQSDACPPSTTAQTDQSAAQHNSESDVIIDTVEFRGANPLSDAQQSKLIGQIQKLPLSKTSAEADGEWAEYAAESIREELQDAGYFRALVVPKPFLIRAGKLELHYALRIVIEDGPRYRLGDIHFKSDGDASLTFEESLLRQQLDLKSGDYFDVSKIRRTLEQLIKLYESKGYIDMVPEPETQITDEDSRIDLTIKINEGSPYRIARIEVLGVGAQRAQDLHLPQSAGEIFNPALWLEFFENNHSELGGGPRPYPNMHEGLRNTVNHTVNLALDFRTCLGTPAVPVLHSRDIELESPVPLPGTPVHSHPSLKSKTESPTLEPDAPKP
jgi:hypothetical protein